MEANFFGPLRTMKGVLPSMRQRNSGVIVNISSAEFWNPHPVASIYAASKFALEDMSILPRVASPAIADVSS